ncbi:MAG: cupin domain-containing protein [Deltaproteobacteria bacterium]|nr:cupin domain-containing protein [Deltaproteobacteria bacterium]
MEDVKAYVVELESVQKNRVEAGVKTSIQVLISPETAPNFAMRCFTIEPGGGMPNHTNTVEHEQYVLGGSAEVGIGPEVYRVKKGDVVFIPAGVPHWYKNEGDEAFRFLCLVPNQPDTIEMIGDR